MPLSITFRMAFSKQYDVVSLVIKKYIQSAGAPIFTIVQALGPLILCIHAEYVVSRQI